MNKNNVIKQLSMHLISPNISCTHTQRYHRQTNCEHMIFYVFADDKMNENTTQIDIKHCGLNYYSVKS